MFEKLEDFSERKRQLEQLISDPDIISDTDKYERYTKEYALVTEIVQRYEEYKNIECQIKGHKEMLNQQYEPEFIELINSELAELEKKKADMVDKIKLLLIPSNPMDSRNTRSGTVCGRFIPYVFEIRGKTRMAAGNIEY